MFTTELPAINYVTQNSIIEEQRIEPEKIMILNDSQVRQQLSDIPEWFTSGQYLSHTYQFSDFRQAIKFINSLVEPSEAIGHHPDISISYNKVTIHLTTHDAGGITQKDIDLAKQITRIVKNF